MRVIVNMQSHVMSDAIRLALSHGGDIKPIVIDQPTEVAKNSYNLAADAVIMEVTAYTPWKLEERLRIRNEIKKRCPNCKIALLVDENADSEIAESVKQAKLDGLIDQFIYGSISASYLAAILETL